MKSVFHSEIGNEFGNLRSNLTTATHPLNFCQRPVARSFNTVASSCKARSRAGTTRVLWGVTDSRDDDQWSLCATALAHKEPPFRVGGTLTPLSVWRTRAVRPTPTANTPSTETSSLHPPRSTRFKRDCLFADGSVEAFKHVVRRGYAFRHKLVSLLSSARQGDRRLAIPPERLSDQSVPFENKGLAQVVVTGMFLRTMSNLGRP